MTWYQWVAGPAGLLVLQVVALGVLVAFVVALSRDDCDV